MPFSQYLSDANLNWLRGTTWPHAAPTTNLFLSLHTSNPGLSGSDGDVTAAVVGGTRPALPQASIAAPATVTGANGVPTRQCTNSALITLSSNAEAAVTITYVGLWDANTAGNFLAYGLVTPPAPLLVGDIIRFPIGNLVIRGNN
jgi:hypothetical protein